MAELGHWNLIIEFSIVFHLAFACYFQHSIGYLFPRPIAWRLLDDAMDADSAIGVLTIYTKRSHYIYTSQYRISRPIDKKKKHLYTTARTPL